MKHFFLKFPKLTNYYLVYTRERDRENLKNGPKNIHYPDIVPSIFFGPGKIFIAAYRARDII